MNADAYVSHADLGGTTGHGAIEYEPEGVVFHHDWEARVLALTVASGATRAWTLDMSRSARETLPDYLDLSYYEIWTAALERLIVDRGIATPDEIANGHAAAGPVVGAQPLRAGQVEVAMARGGPTEREPSGPAAFAVGDRVRTRAGHVDHHTRLPADAAGRLGTVERVHGAHVFPDTNAHGLGEQPQWLYTVVFDAVDLWDDAAPGQRVSIDAWEPYLSPAERVEP